MNLRKNNKKYLFNSWDLIAISIGIAIGIGIFKVPNEIANYLHNPGIILLVWVIGGLITFVGSLCYAELATSIPETGGEYIYLKHCYGLPIGFLFVWSELLVIRPGSIAAMAFIFSEYLRSFLNLEHIWIRYLAILVVILLCSVNVIGIKLSKNFQNWTAVLKVLILISIFTVGTFFSKGDRLSFELTACPLDLNLFGSIGLALVMVLWTYGGWHENVILTGESKDPIKSIPKALFISVLIITLVYVWVNYLYLLLVPFEELTNDSLIISQLMQIIFGDVGKSIFEMLIVISSTGAINALMITSGYITSAATNDYTIFKYFQDKQRQYSTYSKAIISISVISIIYVLTGSFKELLFFTGIAYWLFFILIILGLFIIRKRMQKREHIFRVPFYPFLPLLYLLVCVFLFVNTFISFTRQSLIGLLIIASGFLVYIVTQKK